MEQISKLPAAPQVVADERKERVFLAELLARIHRDGGHRQNDVGTEQAFREADAIVANCFAVAPVQADTSDNAPWLTLAHIICADAGIPPGHILDRLKALRDKLEAPAQEREPACYVDKSRWPLTDENRFARVWRKGEAFDDAIPLFASPVQPVATPDDRDKEIAALKREKLELERVYAERGLQIKRLESLAAPAARGDAKDAERWREALMHVGATVTGDIGARFTLRFLAPVEGTDLMRGGVAGHFTEAIDAAIAAKAAS